MNIGVGGAPGGGGVHKGEERGEVCAQYPYIEGIDRQAMLVARPCMMSLCRYCSSCQDTSQIMKKSPSLCFGTLSCSTQNADDDIEAFHMMWDINFPGPLSYLAIQGIRAVAAPQLGEMLLAVFGRLELPAARIELLVLVSNHVRLLCLKVKQVLLHRTPLFSMN